MDTSRCAHCGRPIFLGPRLQPIKDDVLSWVETWRHVDTEATTCRVTVAEPIREKSDIRFSGDPTYIEIQNELAKGVPDRKRDRGKDLA